MAIRIFITRLTTTVSLVIFFSVKALLAEKFSIYFTPQIALYSSIVKCRAISSYSHFETNNKPFFYPNSIDQEIGLNLFTNLLYKDFIFSLGGGFSKVGFEYKYTDYLNSNYTNSTSTNFNLWELTAGFYYNLIQYPNLPVDQNNKLNVRVYSGIDFSYLMDGQSIIYPINIQSSIVTYESLNQKFFNNKGFGISPKVKMMFRKRHKEIFSIECKYQFGLVKLEELDLEFSVRNSPIYKYELSTYGSYFSFSISKSFLLFKKH